MACSKYNYKCHSKHRERDPWLRCFTKYNIMKFKTEDTNLKILKGFLLSHDPKELHIHSYCDVDAEASRCAQVYC